MLLNVWGTDKYCDEGDSKEVQERRVKLLRMGAGLDRRGGVWAKQPAFADTCNGMASMACSKAAGDDGVQAEIFRALPALAAVGLHDSQIEYINDKGNWEGGAAWKKGAGCQHTQRKEGQHPRRHAENRQTIYPSKSAPQNHHT